MIAGRHGALHPLGCSRPGRTWGYGDRALGRRCQKFLPSERGDGFCQRRMIILGVHRRVDVARRHRVDCDLWEPRSPPQCQRLTRRRPRRSRKPRLRGPEHHSTRLVHQDSSRKYLPPWPEIFSFFLRLQDHLLSREEFTGHIGLAFLRL